MAGGGTTITVRLNGEKREIPRDLSIRRLLEFLDIREERVAVERNREIVSRDRWDEVQLQEGDELEIVHFVGGG
ncbi:MAG: hypothetical protein Kow00109_14370 [Acidobacteriota bacterium]